jgi:3-hydroxybutyrate dehydrogenase
MIAIQNPKSILVQDPPHRARPAEPADEAVQARVLEADHPSKTMVAPADLGALAVFLAGEVAGQIRGAALPMDGGWTAH